MFKIPAFFKINSQPPEQNKGLVDTVISRRGLLQAGIVTLTSVFLGCAKSPEELTIDQIIQYANTHLPTHPDYRERFCHELTRQDGVLLEMNPQLYLKRMGAEPQFFFNGKVGKTTFLPGEWVLGISRIFTLHAFESSSSLCEERPHGNFHLEFRQTRPSDRDWSPRISLQAKCDRLTEQDPHQAYYEGLYSLLSPLFSGGENDSPLTAKEMGFPENKLLDVPETRDPSIRHWGVILPGPLATQPPGTAENLKFLTGERRPVNLSACEWGNFPQELHYTEPLWMVPVSVVPDENGQKMLTCSVYEGDPNRADPVLQFRLDLFRLQQGQNRQAFAYSLKNSTVVDTGNFEDLKKTHPFVIEVSLNKI